MPHDRPKVKREEKLSSCPTIRSRQKRPKQEIEFQTEWATDREGRRCRTRDLLSANPNPRGPTFSPAGETKLPEILADICNGRQYSELFTLIEHDYLSIQQLAREMHKNPGTVSKQYRDEKQRILARAISRYVLNLA